CTLVFAISVGFGVAGVAAAAAGGAGPESVAALVRLVWTSALLGATFLALGFAVSALTRNPGTAAGLAAGMWLIFVVLYDLGLLGALVYDDGGNFTRHVFPWLLAANPADAFRLYNVSASESVALATGLTGAAEALPRWLATTSLALWPVAALAMARAAFGRVEP
ncbi:MAG: ABC transporter permease subunit, partial [Alphaproteobacteria bacterium]